MKSAVFFVELKPKDDPVSELARLIGRSGVLDCVSAGDDAAIKLHFGEQGNTGFVRPALVRVIVDALKARRAKPFLSDTNTLYQGRRTNSAEHLKLAREHGFDPEAMDANVVIPDDTRPGSVESVSLDGKFVKTAKVAAVYAKAQTLIGVAHFKGHLMAGFGGALKNIGMGCASREGKLFQHSDVAPHVTKDCTGCGECVSACSVQAISLNEGRSVINADLCVGCAACLAACKAGAIQARWEQGGNVIQEKMVEYAGAVLRAKRGKSAFFNFCLKITAECDCLAKDDPAMAPDVGILAANDPVALDQASFDLVVQTAGRDVFKLAHPKRDGFKQLRHAEQIGLGTRDYELVRV